MTDKVNNEVDEVYIRLRDRFNSLGFGYAPTESGAEFVLLKRFFTPEDAKNLLAMEVDVLFNARSYADRTGLSEEKAAAICEDMAHRGLIYRVERNGERLFRVMPVAHGPYEFNVNKVEPEWIGGLYTHFGEGLLPQVYDAGIPFYRSVPINKEVVADSQVLPEDEIIKNLKKKSLYAISECMCRKGATSIGARTCEHELETCITTDEMAAFYIENGIGKEITEQDAVEIIERGIENDLIIQTCFSKEGEIICSCSLCCCGILQANKAFPGDGTHNITHYRIEHNRDECQQCGVCAAKCPMASIELSSDGFPQTDASCVGCGHCVASCRYDARILFQKEPNEYDELPDTVLDAYVVMQRNRIAKGTMVPA